MSNKKVCGIDLGTGNSCVAIIEAGEAKVIVNAEGQRTTPSVVYIKGDERKVGGPAKRIMVTEPKNTVSFIKRFMGADFNDPDVQKMLSMITYDVINKNNKPYVKIENKEYSPVEISSMIVNAMKKVADEYYGEEVTDVVITCPAWFNDVQRQATKMAGEALGLNVLRVINEPTAAILASNIDIKNGEKTILVTDVGCGTTDFSVAELSEGLVDIQASHGDVFLGGQNYDDAIVNWIADEFKNENPDAADLRDDPMAYSRIVEAAEKAKIELSTSMQTEINLPYITITSAGPKHFVKSITRAKFEQLTKNLTDRVIECAKEAIKKANKEVSEIDDILLVGGSTRIPALQEALMKAFNKKKLNKSVNPDEAVALGAAIQANVIAGNTDGSDDLVLLDVTPISLGIETNGDTMTKVIESNTTIPTSKKQIFTTAVANQPAVDIKVLQGERYESKLNKLIGNFVLDGIAPAPAHVPQIEVTFDIDANGILSVSAKDLGTGKEQNITIKDSGNLSEDEIAKIKADAEKYAEEDKKKEELHNRFAQAESYYYAVENSLTEEGIADKMTEEEKTNITELNNKFKEVLDKYNSSENKEETLKEIESAQTELNNVYNPIITKIYQEANPQQNGSNNSSNIFDNLHGDSNPFSGMNFEQNNV